MKGTIKPHLSERGLSTIVTVVLIIVITTVLAVLVLSYGQEFISDSTNKIDSMFDTKTELKAYLNVMEFVPATLGSSGYIKLKNIDDKQLSILAYSISDNQSNSYNIQLDSEMIILAGGTEIIPIDVMLPGTKVIFVIYNNDGYYTLPTITKLAQDESTVGAIDFNVPTGTYTVNQSVILTPTTAGSTIYYTTNGIDPTTSSTEYSSAITIDTTTTLKAIAYLRGVTSDVESRTYTLQVVTPTLTTPDTSNYFKNVFVSTTTPGTTIHYTMDGTEPTLSSTLYNYGITLSFTTTLKAKAFKTGWSDSNVSSNDYPVLTLDTPTASFDSGVIPLRTYITLIPADANIYYTSTTDGSEPSNPDTGSTLYGTPIEITGNTKLKAKAYETGYIESEVSTTYDYTIEESLEFISAGTDHTCGISDTGNAYCWGLNDLGQLGDGTNDNRTSPVLINALDIRDIVDISAGQGAFTCAVKSLGGIYCWGAGTDGQLGNGDSENSSDPVEVSGISGTKVSAGVDHACAINLTGEVYCWGGNDYGQLGNDSNVHSFTPVLVDLNNVVVISAGDKYTCAVLEDGYAYCWGSNMSGQLGNNSQNYSLVPVKVSRDLNFTDISADIPTSSEGHTCGITADSKTVDKKVYCWGEGTDGQLGNGGNDDSLIPVEVSGITTAVDISAGGAHSCAVLDNGTVWCWGLGGRLGDGTDGTSNIPVQVSDITTATSVSAGEQHTCARLGGGAGYCWGNNSSWQLGNPEAGDNTLSPVPILGFYSDIEVKVEAGKAFTCAILADGSEKCWGAGTNGQLGDGLATNSSTPVDVLNLSNLVDISTSTRADSCAVTSEGNAYCWGLNDSGQSGNGNTTQLNSPVSILPSFDITKIENGYGHTCAIYENSTVLCWGRGIEGQLGNGQGQNSLTPVIVNTVGNPLDLSLGYKHSCAIVRDSNNNNLVECWGDNTYGQLGDGTKAQKNSPIAVSGIDDAIQVSAGDSHTCAVLDDGTIKCWGKNNYGQSGYPDKTEQVTPVKVGGIENAVFVSAGASHTCAVLENGQIKCWGQNIEGQLGTGSKDTDPHTSPESISINGDTTLTYVSAGVDHTCAVDTENNIWCWGDNTSGELGFEGDDSSTPLKVIFSEGK